MEQTSRRYDVDWIRNITVLSIILFHSLIIFFTRESAIMYVRSGDNLGFCIILEAAMSRIMMPMLFILAGFSTRYSLKNRTIKEYIINRVKKLFIPLVIGSLTLNPIVSYLYGRSIGRDIDFGAHWLAFVTSVSEGLNGLTTGYTPMHLWFLLYLFVFSVVCLPLFMKDNKQSSLHRRSFFSKRGALLLWVIPYILIFMVDILDEMNPIAYLYLFLFGYSIMAEDEIWNAIRRDRWLYGVLAGVMGILSLYCWFYYQGPDLVFTKVIFRISIKGCRMIGPLAIMGFCNNQWINKKSKVLTYLNGANFPIYLYHMLLLTVVGYGVLRIDTNPWIQFILINVITYTLAFLLYECYRRVKKYFNKKILDTSMSSKIQ